MVACTLIPRFSASHRAQFAQGRASRAKKSDLTSWRLALVEPPSSGSCNCVKGLAHVHPISTQSEIRGLFLLTDSVLRLQRSALSARAGPRQALCRLSQRDPYPTRCRGVRSDSRTRLRAPWHFPPARSMLSPSQHPGPRPQTTVACCTLWTKMPSRPLSAKTASATWCVFVWRWLRQSLSLTDPQSGRHLDLASAAWQIRLHDAKNRLSLLLKLRLGISFKRLEVRTVSFKEFTG